MKNKILIILTLTALLFSCKKQTTSNTITDQKEVNYCENIDATYSSTSPIFEKYCIKCHSGGRAAKGINLTDYVGTSTIAKNGKLACVLEGKGCPPMPPQGKLEENELLNLICWIKNGAPE